MNRRRSPISRTCSLTVFGVADDLSFNVVRAQENLTELCNRLRLNVEAHLIDLYEAAVQELNNLVPS